MVNRGGGRYGNIPFRVPDGWEIVKQHRGIVTIRPVKSVNVHSPGITIKEGQMGGVGL